MGLRGKDYKDRYSKVLLKVIVLTSLTLGGIVMVFPFAMMVSSSFKPAHEIYQGRLLLSNPSWDNWRTVWETTGFPRWYLNSLLVAALSTASVAFFDCLAGYTLAKYDFPGKTILFLFILSTLMVPTQMLVIPWYIMSYRFGWIDTYWGIMFPGVITALGVFLMKQFMEGIPNDLLDAARIDGVSEFGIFWRVAIPLVRPALAALCIFNFVGNWNAFLWPVIIIESVAMRTLPVGLSFFAGEANMPWNLIMAGASIATVPVLMVFLFFQRQITKGIALTGLKG